MLKIRLHGLPIDVEVAKKIIYDSFSVCACSAAYPDRGESNYVRMYIDVEF